MGSGVAQAELYTGMHGIILVDHGSRRAAANERLVHIAQLLSDELAKRGRPAIVEPAHMELAEPSIAEALARCSKRGASQVAVVPCMISRGRHVSEDIPALLVEAARAHPDVSYRLAAPLSEQSGFCDLLIEAADAVRG